MKKLLNLFLAVMLIFFAGNTLVACDDNPEASVVGKTYELEKVEVNWDTVSDSNLEYVQGLDIDAKAEESYGHQYLYFQSESSLVHYANRQGLDGELNLIGKFNYEKKPDGVGKLSYPIDIQGANSDEFYRYKQQNSIIRLYPEGDKITCEGRIDSSWAVKMIFKESDTSLNLTNKNGVTYFNCADSPNETWVIGYDSVTPLENIVIENAIDDIPVTKILYRAFYQNTTLKTLTMPNTITEIGRLAFAKCTALESISLSNTLRDIGSECFFECSNLDNVTIPGTVEELSNVFYKCTRLTTVTLSEGLVSIYKEFYQCPNLGDIVLPSTLTDVGYASFKRSRFNSITFPESLEELPTDYYAGYDQGHTTVIKNIILNNATQIESLFHGQGMIYATGVENVYIKNTITTEDSYIINAYKDLVKQSTTDKEGYTQFKVIEK